MNREELSKLAVLRAMDTISLSEMKSVKLMNRVDTKYVASIDLLTEILGRATDDYRVQVVEGVPISSYDTIYFDTDDLEMYHRHHNRVLCRKKVRMRSYLDTGDCFFEIKHKSNKGRVNKKRIQLPITNFDTSSFNTDSVEFLQKQTDYQGPDLLPQLRTMFDRITLVNKEKTERLTIDVNLNFENRQTGIIYGFPDIMIIELKQDSSSASMMKSILMDLRIKPQRISKYCLGTVLTNPAAKYNWFKKKLMYINKIRQQQNHTL